MGKKHGDGEWNSGLVEDVPVIPTEEESQPIEPEEESALAGAPSSAKSYYKKHLQEQQYPSISGDVEQEYVAKAKQGDQEAIDYLVFSNLPFIMGEVRKYMTERGEVVTPQQEGDFIDEAVTVLLESIKRYDPSQLNKQTGKPLTLKTYAFHWLRTELDRVSREQGQNVVDVPEKNTLDYNRYVKAKKKLVEELGHEPSDEEVATSMGISLEELDGILKSKPEAVYLDKGWNEPEGEGVYSEPSIGTEDKGISGVEYNLIEKYINDPKISREEREARKNDRGIRILEYKMRLRPLIDKDGNELTPYDVNIGKVFNMTGANVKYITEQTLDKLRKHFKIQPKEGAVRRVNTKIYKQAILEIFDTFDLTPCEVTTVLSKVANIIENEGKEINRENAKKHLFEILKDIDTDEIIEVLESVINLIEEKGKEEQFNYPVIDDVLGKMDSEVRRER